MISKLKVDCKDKQIQKDQIIKKNDERIEELERKLNQYKEYKRTQEKMASLKNIDRDI